MSWQIFQIRLDKRLDTGGNPLVGQDDDRHAVLTRDVDGFYRHVKTILDIRRRQDDARRIAVAAETGDVQVGLLDVGRHSG